MKKIPILSLLTIPLLFSFVHFHAITLPARYQYSGPFDLDMKFSNHKKGELYFYIDHTTFDATEQNGIKAWGNYRPDSCFTAYLVNATDSPVNLIHQDGSLIMIQEAQDPAGNWAPIEIWYHSDCGNSYMGSPALQTNQYVKIFVTKYKGSFQTKIRLKLKIGKGVFYSEPFFGSVEPEQFKKDKEFGGYKSYLD